MSIHTTTTQKSEALLQDSISHTGAGMLQVLVGYGIVVIFLVLCGWYVYSHRADFEFVRNVAGTDLILPGVLIVVSYLIGACQLRLFFVRFGIDLSAGELIAATMAMMFGNLVIPMRGGTGALAIYLRQVHGLDFRSFAVVYGGTGLLIGLVNSGLAIVGLMVLHARHGFFHAGLTVFLVVMFLAFGYICFFPPAFKSRGTGLVGALFAIVASWNALSRDRGLLLRLTLSFVLVALTLAGSLYGIYTAIGASITPTAVVITSSIGNVANLAALTPGSLGIFDAAVIQVPQLFGLDAARSITAALVFRVLSFGWAAIFGIPGLIYLLLESRKARAGKLTATTQAQI